MTVRYHQKAIAKHLGEPLEVRCYAVIDSTNDEAKRLLAGGKAAPFLLAADAQTAGRGRQGKSFYSPKGTGVYMTVCFPAPQGDILSITSAAAVAVCRAIEALTDRQPQIKWVNDILLEGKKIGGILCEHIGDTVLVGIGINLTTKAFPDDLPHAGALGRVSRARLTAEIVNRLWELKDGGCGAFLADYRKRSCLIGRRITFLQNGVFRDASVLGIDDACGLCVRLDDGTAAVLRSGEISILY